MIGNIKHKATEKMEQTINVFKKDIAAVRTGRASIAIIEGISTTLVVHPDQVVSIDESLNMILQLKYMRE